jgi:hypothetical protein
MRRLILPAVLLLALTGCDAGTATMSGKVSYQDHPVLSGYVLVLNADGSAATGIIQADGSYSVPVKRGRVKIGVVSPDPLHTRSIRDGHAQARSKDSKAHTTPGEGDWYPLPASLGDPEKSGLECDISGSQVTYDIDAK